MVRRQKNNFLTRMKNHSFLVSQVVLASMAFALVICGNHARASVTIYFSGNDIISTVTPPGPRITFATLLPSLQGLAFDTSGNLFVAGGGKVSEITPAGVASDFATLPPGFNGYGMTIDAANNLYVAATSSPQILKITPGGAISVFATLTYGSTGLAIDSIGNLYAVGGDRLIKIPAGGGPGSSYVTLPSNNNYGLAFDSFGYLYVSDLGTTNLLKIPPGGGSYTTFGTLIAGTDGLAFDSSGNLYAAHLFADAISVITPDGTASVFATGLSGPRYLVVKPDPFVLRITAVNKVGNDLRASFNSQTGSNYALQGRADLSSGTWATLAGTTNPGTGGTMQQMLTNALLQPQQFYRAQQLPRSPARFTSVRPPLDLRFRPFQD